MSSLSRGGKERQLATIVSQTDMKRYPTKVIYFNEYARSYIEEYQLFENIIKVNSINFVIRLIELHRILRYEQPDLVFTWGVIESALIIMLRPFHKFIFVNGSIRHGMRSVKFYHYFRMLLLQLSENIVANSYAGLKANYIKKGFVLYNGINDKFIGKYDPQYKHEIKDKLIGNINDKCILISVANLVPYKDYFSILKVLNDIKQEGLPFYYLILGEGPLRFEIEKIISEYGLVDDVRLVGNVHNVEEYLKISDVFIHSSKGEGCSNAILEAMAAGLTVLASDTGGTPEIINKENGFLFQYKNQKQLYDYIKHCIERSDECAVLGENSIKMVRDQYTVGSMMNNYYKIINTLVT